MSDRQMLTHKIRWETMYAKHKDLNAIVNFASYHRILQNLFLKEL